MLLSSDAWTCDSRQPQTCFCHVVLVHCAIGLTMLQHESRDQGPKSSGGLAHWETGTFPGGPLLKEVFRAPGRTREFISWIISWKSTDRLSIQRTGHDVLHVSSSERMTVMYHIHSGRKYTENAHAAVLRPRPAGEAYFPLGNLLAGF